MQYGIKVNKVDYCLSKNVANSGLPGLFKGKGRQGTRLKVSGSLEGMEITVVVGGRTEGEEVNDIIVHLQGRRVRPRRDATRSSYGQHRLRRRSLRRDRHGDG